jgi:hypothetical protein
MFFWRVGGHGCNGKQGEFELKFDPPDGDNVRTHFDYDSHGGLEVTRGPGYPNIYRGQLVPNNPQGDGDKTYTYVTALLHPLVTAGKSVGQWTLICQGICNYQTSIRSTILRQQPKLIALRRGTRSRAVLSETGV